MNFLEALRSYQQADEDGVMVLVSRQACDEAADEIERLRSRVVSLERSLAEKDERILDLSVDLLIADHSGGYGL